MGKIANRLKPFVSQAGAASTALQGKVLMVRSDAEFVALGIDNGYVFNPEDVFWLQPDSEK